jgi:hypothetical protein
VGEDFYGDEATGSFFGDFGRGLGLVGDLEGGCHDFHWDI